MILHIIHLKNRVDRLESLLPVLAEQEISDYVIWEGHKDIQRPSRGIARAHQQIVRWAKQENLPSVIIAEDDIVFTAKRAMDWYRQHEPADYDLYLGGITYGTIKPDNSVDDFAGLHLYTIRQRFYDQFLSLSGETNIDRALAGSGRFLVSHPMVAYQADGYSDNSKSNRSYKAYLKNRHWLSDAPD